MKPENKLSRAILAQKIYPQAKTDASPNPSTEREETAEDRRNKAILAEYTIKRENQIRNEEKMFGIMALALSILTFGSDMIALMLVVFFASIGIKRGQKFEYSTGSTSKQKTLSQIAIIISALGAVIYFLRALGSAQQMIGWLAFLC